MKKLLISLLSCLLVLGLVGCGNNQDPVQVETEEPVVVTLPGIFFEGLSIEQLESIYLPKGVATITINEDASVTMEVPAETYDQLMEELDVEINSIFNKMVDGSKESIEAFKKIEPNEDYSQFDIYVDKATFSPLLTFAGLPIMITSGIYQMFDGKELDTLDVTINYLDESNNELLESFTLKQFLGDLLK